VSSSLSRSSANFLTLVLTLHHRKIFPGHRFAIRTYDCADPEITYESFINGSSGKKFTFERSDDTLNWKVLVRGPDHAVNKLLDWIVC
jgi:hypothetical protein